MPTTDRKEEGQPSFVLRLQRMVSPTRDFRCLSPARILPAIAALDER